MVMPVSRGLPVEPGNCRGGSCHQQADQTAHRDIDPEKIGNLRVGDAFPLNRRRGQTRFFKNPQDPHHGPYHRHQSKIPGRQKTGEHHGGSKRQGEL